MVGWYIMNLTRWTAEQEIAQNLLTAVQSGISPEGQAFIRGDLRWESRHGTTNGPFGIKFVYPDDFPRRRRVPVVYLESHHDVWETDIDGHVFSNWRLCLFIPIESGIDFTRDDSLCALIGLLPPFLTRQRIYQRALAEWHANGNLGDKPKWPGPERSHGNDGYREALAAYGPLGTNAPCLCGSGRSFGECHKRELTCRTCEGHGPYK